MASTIQQFCVYNSEAQEELCGEVDALMLLTDIMDEEREESEKDDDQKASVCSPSLSAALHNATVVEHISVDENYSFYRKFREANGLNGVLSGAEAFVLSERWRFLQLLVAAFCCICISSTYATILYSGKLQKKGNFTQSQMTTISTVSDFSGFLMIPFSAMYDYYGTGPIFFCALILYPLYGVLLGLTFADVIDSSLVHFTLYACLLSISTSLLDMGAVMTLLSIFPTNRGAVVAVMKTFSGMGSAIFGAIYLGFFQLSDDSGVVYFLYFLAILGIVVCFLAFLVIDVPPYMIRGCEKGLLTEADKKIRYLIKRQYLTQKAPTTRFAMGFTVVVIFTFFLPIQGFMSAYMDLSHNQRVAFAITAIVLLVFYSTMALPFRALDRKQLLPRVGSQMGVSCHTSYICRMSRVSFYSRESVALAKEMEYIAPQYQTTVYQSLRTFRFWAFLWTLFSIAGTQIVVSGNMFFVYGALKGSQLDESFMAFLVVVTGVGSGVGRVLLSFFEMKTQCASADKRPAITFTLFIPVVLSLTALLLLLIVPGTLLPLPCLIMSLSNGSMAAAVVIVLRATYIKDVAKHYNCCGIATIAASLLINRLIYGEWYTRQAEKQNGTLCYGKVCVIVPLLVCLGMNLSALLSSFFIHWKYKKYCARMLESRNTQTFDTRYCAPSTKSGNTASSMEVNK